MCDIRTDFDVAYSRRRFSSSMGDDFASEQALLLFPLRARLSRGDEPPVYPVHDTATGEHVSWKEGDTPAVEAHGLKQGVRPLSRRERPGPGHSPRRMPAAVRQSKMTPAGTEEGRQPAAVVDWFLLFGLTAVAGTPVEAEW